jgi:hypothetical protein
LIFGTSTARTSRRDEESLGDAPARTRSALATLGLVLSLAAGASGQERTFDVQVGGGTTVPAGPTTSRYETGWHLTGGAGVFFGDHLGLRFDYTHTWSRLVASAIPEAFVGGPHRVHAFELDARWRLDPGAPAPIEILAGPGLYRRRTEVTSIDRYTPGPSICDPWLGVCAEGPVPPEEILGSRSSTDPGFNLGVAIEVRLWRSVRFLVDIRWRYVWGDAYALPGQASERSTSSYFPVTFGLRF